MKKEIKSDMDVFNKTRIKQLEKTHQDLRTNLESLTNNKNSLIAKTKENDYHK